MSEQEKKSSSYMQELDQWIDLNVILPLGDASQRNEEAWEETALMVKKAIKDKVYTSYKNGLMSRMGGAPENLPAARRYPVPMRKQ